MKHSEQFGQVCLYPAAQAYEKYKKDVINRKVSDVSEMFGISHLLSRGVENLRDGEKQRVALATELSSPIQQSCCWMSRSQNSMQKWHPALVGNAVLVVDAPRQYASGLRTNSSVNMHLRPDAIRIIS